MARILIIEDNLTNMKLAAMLGLDAGHTALYAVDTETSLTMARSSQPDLILMDIQLPGMDGRAATALLKCDRATSAIPVIALTAMAMKANEEKNQEDATEDGIFLLNRGTMRFVEVNATACNLLGYTCGELLGSSPSLFSVQTIDRLENMYDDIIAGHDKSDFLEAKVRLKDGSQDHVEIHRQAQRSGADCIVVSAMRDITRRKEAEKHLQHLAHFDTLTDLPNRTLFYQALRETLAQASDNGWLVAVLFIDLNRFKNVNGTLGHAIGDELLDQFSNRLVQCVHLRDTVGRLGGDEFAMIVVMQDGQQDAAVVASKIREVLRAPFNLHGHEVSITASIGITVYPNDASDPATLVAYADTAMYQAKQAGGNTFRFFTAEMNSKVLVRLELEAALRKALDNGEFVLHYQPKVQLNSGRIAGLEALLRWQRPGHGLVSPADFIPVLEDTGLIVRVGSWVISEVCRQIGEWMRGLIGPVQVSVNVAGRQFVEGEVNGDVRQALRDNGVTADLLELELTESSLMVNTERTIATLQDLKKQGVQISIDDFGTGYSSLAYLRRFPIDKLKIDIAFIREVTSNPDDAAIVLAIISMAHSLKLEVIAEGVETAAQVAHLRRLRCDQIQGYYFSPPLALPELEHILREDKRLPPPDDQIRTPRNTLLLVNAKAAGLRSMHLLLRQDGYHILSARSVAEGFELLAMHQVQVILCDQRMPTMLGTDFLDQVKDLYPDTFRILLSGDTDLEPIMDAINRGAIDRSYTKSADNKVLRDHIREALHRYWLSRNVPPAARFLCGAVCPQQ